MGCNVPGLLWFDGVMVKALTLLESRFATYMYLPVESMVMADGAKPTAIGGKVGDGASDPEFGSNEKTSRELLFWSATYSRLRGVCSAMAAGSAGRDPNGLVTCTGLPTWVRLPFATEKTKMLLEVAASKYFPVASSVRTVAEPLRFN